jgi:hypothetical protein
LAFLIAILVLVLIGLVVLVVGAPLRRAAADPGHAAASGVAAGEARARCDELEAAREAKYREIRDAEMDFRTGKLSEQDYAVLDAELRAEALTILDGLEALGASDTQTQED